MAAQIHSPELEEGPNRVQEGNVGEDMICGDQWDKNSLKNR